MKIETTEQLLQLWGMRYFRGELGHLGYGLTPTARLMGKPGSDIPEEIQAIDWAVSLLIEQEPELAQMLIFCFGHELNSTAVGKRCVNPLTGKPRHRNTVDKMIAEGVAWIAGHLNNTVFFNE